MGILDKIADIEKEIAKTQKNKGELSKFIVFANSLINFYSDFSN